MKAFHLIAFLCQKLEERDAPNAAFWMSSNGANVTVTKVLEEQTDIYSFILYNMGLTYPKEAK